MDTQHSTKRAILYACVSTDEQARSGYSLAQQMEALRAYAATEGYEVLEEVSDPGQSGASLERPGMDRVRDLVAAGEASVVLAQDRDRFAREPAYHYLLKREFEENGCKVRSLNDRGDESPEGELTDGILDQLAKFERAKTTERTRRGRLRKAREGKLIASGTPLYGYRYTADREHYEVDERTMPTVRRILSMVGEEGMALHAVKKRLESEGVPPPVPRDADGNPRHLWDLNTIRGIVDEEAYRPHTPDEMREVVSAQVAAALPEDHDYGIVFYNRRKTTTKRVRENGEYKTKQIASIRPRSEWIGVPVPHAGMPRELVDSAREAVKDNRKGSWAGGAPWELSGGVLLCGGCGCRMVPNHRRNSAEPGKVYCYYRCPRRQRHGAGGCPNGKSFRAEPLEGEVWEFIYGYLTDPEQLRADLERMIEAKHQEVRGDPDQEIASWADRLAELDRKREGYWDLAAGGDMPRDLMRAKVAELEEQREAAERELAALRSRKESVAEMEQDREALLRELEGNTPEALESLSPEERNQFYKMLHLKVTAHPDGTLTADGAFSEAPVCVRGEDQKQSWVTGQILGVDGGLSTLHPMPRRSQRSR